MKKFVLVIVVVFVAVFGLFSQRAALYKQWRTLNYLTTAHSLVYLRPFPGTKQRVVTFFSDSLKIVADLFPPGGTAPTPAIILLHGSSVQGRKLPVNQLLAAKFQDFGYTALAIDLRGYGDSQDPKVLRTESDFQYAHDVTAGINFLLKKTNVDSGRIFIFGHSFGAGVGLWAARADQRIKKLVLFGPPRRLRERVLNPGAPDRDMFLKRWREDMELPYPLDFAIWKEVLMSLDIESYMNWLKSPGHLPIFLIDSEIEYSPEDNLFLRNIFLNMSPPKKYWTVPSADHYLNTRKKLFGTYWYDSQLLNDFVQTIDNWLKVPEKIQSAEKTP